MTKKEWQDKYCVADIDMELIDAGRACGCKVVAVENPPLDYEIIKYDMIK